MTLSAKVTRYPYTLGARSTVTGWRQPTLGAADTIDMLIAPRGSREYHTPAGYRGSLDALGMTADVVTPYDHVVTPDGRRYEAKYVHEVWELDNFNRRDCALADISDLYEALSSSTATWKTAPDDPRSRAKAWIDTNARDAQLLKDDGVTQAAWATIFASPPYPLTLEFRGTSHVQGLYAVDVPTSTAHIDAMTWAPYAYTERVPITAVTVDSTGCSGHQLNYRMTAELRYCFESFPTGSILTPGGQQPRTVELGGMPLYMTECLLEYQRDTTT